MKRHRVSTGVSLAFAALLLIGLMIRFLAYPAQVVAGGAEPYRVEMIHNDPYKIQVGLNTMANQGFYYVSSISRADGKVLLIFRKSK